ncbi:glycosyltransferase family 1 protein [Labrenzia sp. PHM005]|uniref:glycosyltransferase family 4 protein n=1 Tax=Labrenzia sp. PHM005 TaxID=2590016 RepID=UPI00113FDF07|nr:glycosyltransferase family 1 protein [Labrenzia sp. PHM005]QDG78503.1 glycosyltransferase family 1 protein [Labrenzia sp. PHM005]
MKSILFVTDAWHPQINGVVRTIEYTAHELIKRGIRVEYLTPQSFRTLPCPTYPEIRLALTTKGTVRRIIREHDCEHIHIATEGPLGLLAAAAAKKEGRPFSTSYHTRFPEYVSARVPLPKTPFYVWFRRFHNSGTSCMVATAELENSLKYWKFQNLMRWPRGVDTDLFQPYEGSVLPPDLPRPVFMNVGRVSVEKNIKAFLDLDLPGSKVVVGEGPQLDSLRRAYPDVLFTGSKTGVELAQHYSSADVFVFPSKTDTFGLVLLEALACGVPVAAYPIMGPIDVVGDSRTGVLSSDLRTACLEALNIQSDLCRAAALEQSWSTCTDKFLENIDAANRAHGTTSA